MIKFSLRQLEYAVEAADKKSVAAAALQFDVSQPTVSAAIKVLEDRLGFHIFVRQAAKGIAPSPQGLRFISEARALLAHARDVESIAKSVERGIEGELRVGSFLTLGPTYMPGLISAFSERHPHVAITPEEGDQEKLLDGLRSGRLDAALLYRVDLPADIRARDVALLKPHVILPHNHRLARHGRVALRDLEGEPFIALNTEPSRTYFLRVLATAGVRPGPGFSSASIEMVRGMVACGMGYSLLITRPPGDMSYDGKKIAVRSIRDVVEDGVVALVMLRNLRRTKLVQAFEEFCVQHFHRIGRTSGKA